MKNWFFTAFILLIPLTVKARTFKKMDVPKGLQTSLNTILKAGSDLQVACAYQKEDGVDRRLDALAKAIVEARKKTSLLGAQKTHMDRILVRAANSVDKARKHRGESRAEPLKSVFTELVQIEQVFKVDPYNIFFCGKDSVVWIQKEKKPINPVHPHEYRACGSKVQ
jgi:hypothetical protein